MSRLSYLSTVMFFPAFLVIIEKIFPENSNLILPVFIAYIIVMGVASAFRLRNIGWMPGYAWVFLIPFLNIPLIYYCCHLPMNYVIHGEVDLAGRIIRTIFWFLFTFPIIAIIIGLLIGEIP